MRSIFSQLLLLLALVLGQHQSWAENNCQHMTNQADVSDVMDHTYMNHADMNHGMNDTSTPDMENCCDDCACDFNSCHSQSIAIVDTSKWSYTAPNTLNKLSQHWQLSHKTTPLLRPPSLT